MAKKIFFLSMLVSLAGCGLLDRRQRTEPAAQALAAVQDVPFEARPASGEMRKRIMILPFLDEKLQRSQMVREAARRSVVQELNRTQAFVIIANDEFPQDLAKFVTEQNEYDLPAIARIAAGLGIAAILEGKVMEVKARRTGDGLGLVREIRAQVETTVRTRIVSSRNGRVIFDEARTATIEDSTTKIGESSFSDRFLEEDPNLVRQAVQKGFANLVGSVIRAIDKLSWEGRVAMVTGERVFINAGRLSGIQVGDLLKVSEDGKEVFDPESGLFIGNAPGRMKGTLEVISYFGKDGSVGVVHSGSGFKENDRVELY